LDNTRLPVTECAGNAREDTTKGTQPLARNQRHARTHAPPHTHTHTNTLTYLLPRGSHSRQLVGGWWWVQQHKLYGPAYMHA
jgi:hypothetical protein